MLSLIHILLCLDVTEAVLDEAIALGYNLVISHHPLIFKGYKSITGKDYVEPVSYTHLNEHMDRKDIYILFLNSSELSNSIALLPAVIIS